MNEVDYLLEHKFETLTLEEKLEVKRLGAHQPWDIVLTQTAGKVAVNLTRSGLLEKSG